MPGRSAAPEPETAAGAALHFSAALSTIEDNMTFQIGLANGGGIVFSRRGMGVDVGEAFSCFNRISSNHQRDRFSHDGAGQRPGPPEPVAYLGKKLVSPCCVGRKPGDTAGDEDLSP